MMYEDLNEKNQNIQRQNKKKKDLDFKRTVSVKSDAKDYLTDLSWKEEMMSGNYHTEKTQYDKD